MEVNLFWLSQETVVVFASLLVFDLWSWCHTLLIVLQSKMTWGPYFWFQMWRMTTSTVSGSEDYGILWIHRYING